MTLQEKLKIDLHAAMKEKDEIKKQAIRLIMGELARQSKKDFTDDEIIAIIRKMVKNEKEVMELTSQHTTPLIYILESYLPVLVNDETVMEWITENIDFSKFKNKMQAMGVIMKHFGTTVEGNSVKQLLLKNF